MNILTIDNESYEIDYIPEQIDDIRYSVLDYSNKNDVDYIFQPLVFLEIFNSPAAILSVNNTIIKVPLDWSIIIGEPETNDPEVIPVSMLTTRGFRAFCFNPLTSVLPSFYEVRLINVYNQVKWYSPKLKYGHFLTIPISHKKNPECLYFIKETGKIPDVLDTKNLW